MKIASFRNDELTHVGLDAQRIRARDKQMVSSARVSGLGGALPALSLDDIRQGSDAQVFTRVLPRIALEYPAISKTPFCLALTVHAHRV